jgi:PadR family transcriptional regulator, regulatory protein PadR
VPNLAYSLLVTTGATNEEPAAWLRGVIELAAAAVLAEGDNHGYAVAQRLNEAGFGRLKGGVLYPVLARLESDGVLSSTWAAGAGGPGRKVYSLTGRGARWLSEQGVRWGEFAERMDRLLSSTGALGDGDTARSESATSTARTARTARTASTARTSSTARTARTASATDTRHSTRTTSESVEEGGTR